MEVTRDDAHLIHVPRTYFDSTFYDSIDKGRVARAAVEEFKAMSGRKIRGFFSPGNADELIANWPADRAAAVRKLQRARIRLRLREVRPRKGPRSGTGPWHPSGKLVKSLPMGSPSQG